MGCEGQREPLGHPCGNGAWGRGKRDRGEEPRVRRSRGEGRSARLRLQCTDGTEAPAGKTAPFRRVGVDACAGQRAERLVGKHRSAQSSCVEETQTWTEDVVGGMWTAAQEGKVRARDTTSCCRKTSAQDRRWESRCTGQTWGEQVHGTDARRTGAGNRCQESRCTEQTWGEQVHRTDAGRAGSGNRCGESRCIRQMPGEAPGVCKALLDLDTQDHGLQTQVCVLGWAVHPAPFGSRI